MIKWTFSCALVAAIALGSAGARALPKVALDPGTRDPRTIMRAALDQASGDRTLSRMKMTIRDHSGTRERKLNARTKRFAQGRKSLILIEDPPDVRNTGFLSIDYHGGKHADEQWLYLPKLHRTTRVPSSGKSDAFVGSDFTYADLAEQDPDDYALKLIELSAKVGDEDCWLIEAVPASEAIKEETGYVKTQLWISKSKLIPLQLKASTLKDGKTKYFKATDVREVDRTWTPHRLQMRTLKGSEFESETVIEVLSVKNDAPEVTDADFTQQRLERGL